MQDLSPTVVIIGAGAAGLAAARVLEDSRVHVVVLEARHRSGGRVLTSFDWPEVAIDLGASWVHGSKGNPVTDLRDQFGIKTVVTDTDSVSLYDENGQRLPDARRQMIEEKARVAIQHIDRPDHPPSALESIKSAVDAAVDKSGLTGTDLMGLRFFIREHFENEWGAGPSQLSARWYCDTAFTGAQEVFPGGYSELFDRLASDLEIRYQEAVTKIHYGSNGVQVVTGTGSLKADYAIVTVPLGVLKDEAIAFLPELPPEKREAISKLKMGVLAKTWLRFPKAFWSSDDLIHGYLGSDDGIWSSWHSFLSVTGQPLLLGLNGGDSGREIETYPDPEIVDQAMSALRGCFGSSVPNPTGLLNSRWTTDPFSLGSYSHIPPGASPVNREQLAQPLAGRLLFAGEATHPTCSQTVHGAILSGQREARRILAALAPIKV
jgi:monoamine oxidase